MQSNSRFQFTLSEEKKTLQLPYFLPATGETSEVSGSAVNTTLQVGIPCKSKAACKLSPPGCGVYFHRTRGVRQTVLSGEDYDTGTSP